MAAEVPAGFVVLSRAEAATAMAGCRIAAEHHRPRVFRGLADDLERVLRAAHEPMSAFGRLPAVRSDVGAWWLGGINGSTLSVAEAAQLLDLSHRQASRYLPPDGPLRGVKVGKSWVLDRASVEELLEQRRRTA